MSVTQQQTWRWTPWSHASVHIEADVPTGDRDSTNLVIVHDQNPAKNSYLWVDREALSQLINMLDMIRLQMKEKT